MRTHFRLYPRRPRHVSWVALSVSLLASTPAVALPSEEAPGGWSEVRSTASEGTVQAANRAVAFQLAALGVTHTLVDPPVHATLKDAVRAFLRRHDALSAVADERLGSLDSIPEQEQRALTAFVDSFLAFEDAVDRRNTAIGSSDLEPTTSTGLADVAAARSLLAKAAEEVATTMQPDAGAASTTDDAPLQLPPWFSLSIGVANDTYETDFVLLIDQGGSDTYANNAGGSNMHGGACEFGAVSPSPAAALVDVAGNDFYTSGRSCGANGGGAALGAGFLFDGDGDDIYTAGSFGTNGGGNFGGVGFLADRLGRDEYTGGGSGVNGGGAVGFGLLVDGGGIDSYQAGSNGTNGGAALGAGGLADLGGGDDYRAGDVGTNGGANGGVAFLLDAGGDDTYTAGDTGVNGGASIGTSFLVDVAGDDDYSDQGGGTGDNRTVMPKGAMGAQVDLPA